MIKAIWNKNLEVYNAQLSLPKNIQNLTVTGSKQNQMVKLYSRAHSADAILSKSGSTDVKLAYLSQKLFCNY